MAMLKVEAEIQRTVALLPFEEQEDEGNISKLTVCLRGRSQE